MIEKKRIWDKGQIVEGFDKDLIRQDSCGAWIVYDEYGNRDSVFGWEIDHVYPQSKGGDDSLINLRPMNWRNNESKGDDYPHYEGAVVAKDKKNVEMRKSFVVNEKLRRKLEELYR